MTMLLATLIVSVASVAGGSSYAMAQSITVPDGDITLFGPYRSGTEDWWKFNANPYDITYIDLDYTFTQNGGKEYLHDPNEVLSKQHVCSSRCTIDHTGWLGASYEINRGSSSSYDYVVG